MSQRESDSGNLDDHTQISGSLKKGPDAAAEGETSSTQVPPGASLVGSHLKGYLVLSRLGRGGMADVYSARDISLDRDVAIKVLRRDLARDREYIARFRREARAAAKLNHPNIVQIYEVGEEDTRHYIVQELITGSNLREQLERHGTFTPDRAVEVLVGVASALDAAATEGITHRDIKPENVMQSKSGLIKVADFGLARVGGDSSRADLTQAGLTLGTPRYMSPEQVQGKPVDPRSDLYSLGVMMYHLLAGRPPFEASDPLALAFAHVNETPAPLDRIRGDKEAPEWLIAIISKLMRKDPAERFQSAAELLEALGGETGQGGSGAHNFTGAQAATARLQRIADEQRRRRGRKRLKTAMLSLVPVLAFGIGALANSWTPSETVSKILSTPSVAAPSEVTKLSSVQEQFVHAVEENGEAEWMAVSYHFPAGENAVNRSYDSKAKLQLARFYESQNQFGRADRTLVELIDAPSTDEKYRLIALAWRVKILDLMDDPRGSRETKQQFGSLRDDLQRRNPEAVELFNRIVPPREQADIQLPQAPQDS